MSRLTFKMLLCLKEELRLDITLCCGQSFRWQETNAGVWTGVIGDAVWQLSQTDTHILYRVFYREPCHVITQSHSSDNHNVNKHHLNDKKLTKRQRTTSNPSQNGQAEHCEHTSSEQSLKATLVSSDNTNHAQYEPTDQGDCESIIKDYFQLSYNLKELYAQWAKSDPVFKNVATSLPGIRILRQDPVENLFSFICSSNNNIYRITSMVEKLSVHYGEKIAEIDGKSYFSFPSVEALAADGVEDKLRSLGFGFRARYISETAQFISKNHGDGWLHRLRQQPYPDVKAKLMKLHGVGAKVADCVCLMSLDKLESVPVDTHVWQIAARDYMPKLRQTKTLTDKLYNEIGDHFRQLWGPCAGWAQSVLFTADLAQFKDKMANTNKKSTNEEMMPTKSKKNTSSSSSNLSAKLKHKKAKR